MKKMHEQFFTPQVVNRLVGEDTNSKYKPAEAMLLDTALWFLENRRLVPDDDLQKRVELLEVFAEAILNSAALMLKRVQEAERKGSFLSGNIPLVIPEIGL